MHIRMVQTVSIFAMLTLVFAGRASATVLTFDDRPQLTALTGGNYGGLSWEAGNLGFAGMPGYWGVPSSAVNHPHSGLNNAINAGGSTLIGIGFPTATNLVGAYIAGQGEPGNWTNGLRLYGYSAGQEITVTPWFTTIDATPRWFDMSSLTNVDRVVFESIPVENIENTGYFGMDDFTFTAIPEPATSGTLAVAGLSLLGRRLRKAGLTKGRGVHEPLISPEEWNDDSL